MSKASTPKTRLQRTSNPTPPEPESSKKYIIDMSQNNPDMDCCYQWGSHFINNFDNVF
jgi:hypothetical protein